MNAIRIANPLTDRRTVAGRVDEALRELETHGHISAEWAASHPKRRAAILRLVGEGWIRQDGDCYVPITRGGLSEWARGIFKTLFGASNG